MKKKCLALFGFALALLLAAPITSAQNAAGSIVGTVTDPQGAVVPGAKVTVSNDATGVNDTALTSSAGYFEILALPIGNYHLTVESQGFSVAVTQSKKLEINQTLRFDVRLTVGSTKETITVVAKVSGVETVNATVGDSVTGQQITDMPLNGRNVLDLALLQPGVTDSNLGAQHGSGFSVAGGRPEMVTYLMDGGNNNNLLNNDVVFNPNPDSIAEFRILESNYSAEYGRNAGGIVSVVTKSGTNKIHGSAFDYVRNDAFDANSYFNIQEGLPRADLKRHQFGGTLGGPVTIPHVIHGHDRYFFFVSYQGQRQTDAETVSQSPAFTPAELKGDFSQAVNGGPDPNVAAFLLANPFFQSNSALAAQAIIDPTKINAAATSYIGLNVIPTSASGLISEAANATDNSNELTGKLDINVSDKDKISFTVGGQRLNTVDPFAQGSASAAGFPVAANTKIYFSNIAYTRTLSPNMLNDLRFTAQRSYRLAAQPSKTLPGPQALGFNINPDVSSGPPFMSFNDGLNLGFNTFNGPTAYADNTFALSDILTWVKGNSTWKFGGGISPYQDNLKYGYEMSGYFFFADFGPGTGNEYANFLLGIPNSFSQGPNAPNNVRTKASYGFVQDEWRVRTNLVLSLGLRYDYSTPKLDTLGRTQNFLAGAQSSVRFVNAPVGLIFPGDPGAPRGTNFADHKNFAPRLGFAWDPWNDHKTSIRGGAGIFWDIVNASDNVDMNGGPPYAGYASISFPNLPPVQSSPVTFMSDPYGSTGHPDPFPSKPPTPTIDWVTSGFLPWGVSTADPHLRAPYVYQYNLSVQRELANSLVAEVNYVGSDSKNLPVNIVGNPMILGTSNRVLNVNQTNSEIVNYCASYAASNNSFIDPVLGAVNPASVCPFQGWQNTRINRGFASYNSLQAALTKHNSSNRWGATYFTLGYTYAHSIDNASGRFNNSQGVPAYEIGAFRGSSDFDVTNRITFSGGWDIPFERAWSSGPQWLLKGWTLYPIFSWRTGFPQTVNSQLGSGYAFDDPGTSGAGDLFLTNALFAAGFTGVQTLNPKNNNNAFFNPATFTANQYAIGTPCSTELPAAQSHTLPSSDCAETTPSLRTYGTGRGIFRGPGRTNLDLALAKSTHVYENLNAELRLEAFNVFNHAEFEDPNTNLASPTFGQVFATYDPRIVQIALRLTF